MKRVILLVVLFIFAFGASCWAMTEQEIGQAISIGHSAADNKNDFVCNERDIDHVYSGTIFATLETQGVAYIQNPFCVIATKALQAKKQYEDLNMEDIKNLTNTLQIITISQATSDNVKLVQHPKIVIIQGNNIIHALNVQEYDAQKTIFGGVKGISIGAIASFNVNDIDFRYPIQVKVITSSSKELTYNFNLPIYTNQNVLALSDSYKFY